MTLETYTYLLQHPQHIDAENTNALESLLKDYPYLQSGRALYLNGLKNKQSFKYNQQLKTTAAYTTDRSVLFDYVTSEIFNQNEISDSIKRNSEQIKHIIVHDANDISVSDSVTIDNALKEHIKASEATIDPQLFEVRTQEPVKDNEFENLNKTEETSNKSTLGLGKPLDFSQQEKHSFAEWLKLTRLKPIERANTDTSNTETHHRAPLEEKLPLIDKFLTTNPKIEPSKTATPKLMEVSNFQQSDGLMTETLARVFLEQKNFEKAIQSYKILSLKYPEKSGFFADQIKIIKELQEKNNT